MFGLLNFYKERFNPRRKDLKDLKILYAIGNFV